MGCSHTTYLHTTVAVAVYEQRQSPGCSLITGTCCQLFPAGKLGVSSSHPSTVVEASSHRTSLLPLMRLTSPASLTSSLMIHAKLHNTDIACCIKNTTGLQEHQLYINRKLLLPWVRALTLAKLSTGM